ADGGTLFLDELGDMPMSVQVKLLRALQEGEVEPLGSNKLVRFDVRVVAATSRDVQQMVRDGTFREDLYYRLNVLPVRVPPLRERRADIALLIEALGEDIAARGGGPQLELTPDAQALLAAQAWRGNIRELRNVLEQLALRSDSHHIEAAQVVAVLQEAGLTAVAWSAPEARPVSRIEPLGAVGALRPLPEQIAELEQQAIRAALAHTNGNRTAAAKLLGISRASLYDRLADTENMSEN
ncbi:MAG: sigma 54-interacting transcriptional regulator, partial [Hydrogenophaga sp.]|nr:sigma 54-interacting transcriptional regulator [Hydrogenophaga sp.]